MLRASKLYHSVSTSGPSSTWYPSDSSTVSIWRWTCVSTCRWPRPRGGPGNVMSIASVSARSASRASSSSWRLAASAPSIARLASLAAWLRAARSRGRSCGRDTRPRLPRARFPSERVQCPRAPFASALADRSRREPPLDFEQDQCRGRADVQGLDALAQRDGYGLEVPSRQSMGLASEHDHARIFYRGRRQGRPAYARGPIAVERREVFPRPRRDDQPKDVSRRRAYRLGTEWIRGALEHNESGRTGGRCSARDCAHIAGILHSVEHDQRPSCRASCLYGL